MCGWGIAWWNVCTSKSPFMHLLLARFHVTHTNNTEIYFYMCFCFIMTHFVSITFSKSTPDRLLGHLAMLMHHNIVSAPKTSSLFTPTSWWLSHTLLYNYIQVNMGGSSSDGERLVRCIVCVCVCVFLEDTSNYEVIIIS